MILKPDAIVFLLGAGTSREAGIPTSTMMINKVEKLLEENKEWQDYRELYYCIKSSIIHGFGIIGDYDENLVNIETLVNTMDELTKSIKHPIYPFVGSWIPRLTELTNNNFKKIELLRKKIVSELYNWMEYEQRKDIDYFKGFLRFQNQYKYDTKIFTLNYDKCIEDACGEENINRGFDPINHTWSWKNFANKERDNYNIILYKLHGSIDWAKSPSGIIIEKMNKINEGEEALIFGTTYKMQYLDPFLYLIYEFRQQTLDPRTEAIICIGYSFGDEHINGIIKQSITDNYKRKLIIVTPSEEIQKNEKSQEIMKKIGLDSILNIIIISMKAKEFLERTLNIDFIKDIINEEDIPF